MVGSRDYFDTDGFDGNFNITTAPRQPGSAFKPIAYAAAFENGYLPESTIFDTETQFNSRCEAEDTTSLNGCYSPNNYDFKFNGPMTFRDALAQSRNIPAIKISYLAGLSNVIQKARDLGITSLTQPADFYGLGLVLGGGEVSLLEMTSSYTVFANDGKYNKPTSILEITDIQGNTIEKFVSKEDQVLDKNAARMVNSILSDNTARSPLFGSQSFLYFGEKDVAGKTGTTNDNRDAWLVGYSPDVAVGVWTGNNDNSPMKKGSTITGKPWREFMDEVMENYDNNSFENYELPEDLATYPNMLKGDWYGGTTIYIDSVSGKLATEFTPEETKIAVPQPDPHTILHWINKNNPSQLDLAQNDSQYKNWEYGVRKYADENLAAILNIDFDIPEEYDDVHTADGGVDSFDFDIRGLDEREVYALDQEIDIRIKNQDRNDNDIDLAQFFVNNTFIASKTSKPFSFSFIPESLPFFEENNLIRVILTDEDGIKSSQEVSFTLEL
jgi:membrane peptidoglycan carboxypeptidase